MKKEIRFSKKIYTKKAIENSIGAFCHLARFRISADTNHFIVSVDAIDKDVKDVFKDEFCDFVLAELKKG